MSKKPGNKQEGNHSVICECPPPLLISIIENAGRELSRRQLLKGAGIAGGMLAFGNLLSACGGGAPASSSQKATQEKMAQDGSSDANADTIYHGGPIITMVKDGDRAEAIAVKDGNIVAVGAMAAVMTSKGPNTNVIDLEGNTLIPGFFDPHSHLVLQSVKFATANLDPKPIGEVGSIADIQRIVRGRIREKQIAPGKWVIGWGYDDTGIEEKRHPTRDDLDAVSTEHPIMLMHISGHLLTGNSKMLEAIGVSAESADPDGGVIQRSSDSKEPNGILEENAMLLVLHKMPMPTPERAMDMIADGIQFYAEAGITTAQDCATFKGTWQLLAAMEQQNRLPIDVITWPVYKGVDDAAFNAIVERNDSRKRLRLGGVKIIVDGSIQGYTAFLSEPYHIQPDNVHPTPDKCDTEQAERIFVNEENKACNPEAAPSPDGGHRGYPGMTQEQIETWLKRCDDSNLQMQVHTNGDAATDMLIKAVEKVRAEKPRPDLRTTIIHAQTMRDDQLDFSARHGLTPSFFPIHVYFWGDRHRDLFLGPERSARINPARSALDRNIKVSLHHDAPVAGISMLNVAWTAVNRITSDGKKLGPEECITPFEALRAITADAAWQNFEEDRKGTLETGKLADLVVLSDDPLTIDPMKIKDIQVLETIKEGKTIFKKT